MTPLTGNSILRSIAACALLFAAGCQTYDSRQAEYHEIVLYWQNAETEWVDWQDQRVKIERLPVRDGEREMRIRHHCSKCGMNNIERVAIVDAVAEREMAAQCPSGHTVIDSGHTIEPLGQQRNYRPLTAGIQRYLYRCTATS